MEGVLFLRRSSEVLLRFRRPSSAMMEPCEEAEDLADDALVLRWNKGKNLDRMSAIITTELKYWMVLQLMLSYDQENLMAKGYGISNLDS